MSRPPRHPFELSSKKRALLQARLREEGIEQTPSQEIRPREGTGTVPPSFAQRRLWVFDQLEMHAPTFNITRILWLSGRLNEVALGRSIDAIVERHEALRTIFPAEAGRPIQLVVPPSKQSLPTASLTQLATDRREDEVRRLASEEARRPFDLVRGPLVRTALFELDEQEHALILSAHHIICDGWSMRVFVRELAAFYESYSEGKPPQLSELPVQYGDFVAWQHDQTRREEFKLSLDFWKGQLSGNLPALDLPTVRPRPSAQTFEGAVWSFKVPKRLTDKLKALSHRGKTTLFMVLLTAWKALLYRYVRQDTVVVGTPIAGRNRTELEGLIGFFVNTLVLRTDLSGDPTFEELLGRVRDVCLGAYEHQDVPFEKLVEELQPERDRSRNPLFNVMFILQNTPRQALELEGLELSQEEVERGASMFDLTLSLMDSERSMGKGQGLIGRLEYSTDLFDAATVDRLACHYLNVLEGAVSDPGRRISLLPLLSPRERRELLSEWNDTGTDHPADGCVPELFAEQARRTPEAAALVFEGAEITYRELDQRSSSIARRLRELRVGPEVLVGVCLERSPELVASLLGVLKAGGAYVPLDPSYPKERLEFMLGDSGARVLLTQQQLLEGLPNRETEVVCLDADRGVVVDESGEQLDSGAMAGDLAYVLYTSGSTGKPKGVGVEQRQLLNRLAWMWEAYPFAEGEVLCQRTSINFVDSMWEIFGPLLRGIPSVIVPNEVSMDLDRFVEILAANRVTRVWLVPSLLRAVLDVCPDLQSRLPKLRMWFVGGEPLSGELSRRFADAVPHATLFNMYGASEFFDATIFDPGTDGAKESLPRVPIGRPIANARVYVLDGNLQPVPVGVPGKLYIGGVGVARGYPNLPGLTAEKFVPDPFRGDPGARMYETGDLARWLPDGNVEFLGRTDHQVKVRGFRVEPGEVEAVLIGHPGVSDAAVAASREDSARAGRLIAYPVFEREEAPTAGELRGFLRKRLPDYMVPSQFVPLDVLPLTPSGKTDRLALPEPNSGRPELGREFVAPRNPVEKVLAGLWAEVLGLERVGVNDDFFELGGDSVMAIQVVSRIHEALQVGTQARILFEEPTVASLASRIMEVSTDRTRIEETAGRWTELQQLPETELEGLLEELASSEEEAETG